MRDGMRGLKIIAGTVICTHLAVIANAHADTLRLDKLDRATEVYLQRGLHGADSQCFGYILKKLRKEGAKNWYIVFDEPDQEGVKFGGADTDSNYSCKNGRLVSEEMGETLVIKKFK